MAFHSFDFDLDPINVIIKLDIDMVKMYLHTKDELPSRSGFKSYIDR